MDTVNMLIESIPLMFRRNNLRISQKPRFSTSSLSNLVNTKLFMPICIVKRFKIWDGEYWHYGEYRCIYPTQKEDS